MSNKYTNPKGTKFFFGKGVSSSHQSSIFELTRLQKTSERASDRVASNYFLVACRNVVDYFGSGGDRLGYHVSDICTEFVMSHHVTLRVRLILCFAV